MAKSNECHIYNKVYRRIENAHTKDSRIQNEKMKMKLGYPPLTPQKGREQTWWVETKSLKVKGREAFIRSALRFLCDIMRLKVCYPSPHKIGILSVKEC